MKKVSVVIPTKNEPLINEIVGDVNKILSGTEHEVIVVDLSDKIPEVKDARLIRQKSIGLGNAVIEGLEHATGDVIVVMDADYSHDPNDIPRFLEKTKQYDMVLGSRYVDSGSTEDSTFRYFIPSKFVSKLFCKLASSILQLSLKDPMSGYAAVRKEVYDSIELKTIGYKIHMETAFKAKKKGFTVCEIPIVFRKRREGKSKAGIKEALRTLYFIFRLRLGLN